MTAEPARILIVDDEFSIRSSFQRWFQKEGYAVTAVGGAAEALKAIAEHRYDVALLDLKLGGMDGLELQEHVRRRDPETAVIIFTAFASVDTAVRALKAGAFDYLTKPVDPHELSRLVRRAVEHRRLREENLQLRGTIDELVAVDPIVGESPPMRAVLELVEHVAKTDATVLICGESGTGKELIARAIHAKSKRRYSPLVPVNCGALPETLLESELFGYEKGAFTGADCCRKGRIEAADGGTLFLDEVGAVAVRMQVDLLRVLEAKELVRVGGTQPVKVDFRVICATNENLEIAVANGRFREDLYYRINVFKIQLPALRDRRADIPPLACHFLHRFAGQMDKRISGISPEAMKLLVDYDWPGNVRELSNALERAMVVGSPPHVRPEDLPLRTSIRKDLLSEESWADLEKRHIAAVLDRTGGNVTRAAEILKIDRVTVYNKIKKYGLRP